VTPDQMVDVLTVAASFDRRTVGHADVLAWHAAVGDLDAEDARDAVIAHYARSTDWLMPAHVRSHVARIRGDRLTAAGSLEAGMLEDGIDPDDPTWTAELRARREASMARHPSRVQLPSGRPFRLVQGGER